MVKKTFKVKKRKTVFSKGPIHLVDCDVAMPGGRILSRQILEHPGSVVIIPKIRKNRYILIRQFRFATRSWMWEWPAGGIEKGESFSRAAARELREEIGYHPRRLKKLMAFFPTPGISAEKMHLFLGDRLIERKSLGDEDEEIEVHEFSLNAIAKMIRQGLIEDAKTILGFHLLNKKK